MSDIYDEMAAKRLPCDCFERDGRGGHLYSCAGYWRDEVAEMLRAQGLEIVQAKEAIAHLTAGKPLGELFGQQIILNQAAEIVRLKAKLADAETDQVILENIYLALDGLPTSGERTGPKSVKHLGAPEQITRLRAELVNYEEALSKIANFAKSGG